jgi:hypothetical protein
VSSLAVVFGFWPAFDPRFEHKRPYLTVVIALLVVGNTISANYRWRLERSYRQRDALTASELQGRTWEILTELALLGGRVRIGELDLTGNSFYEHSKLFARSLTVSIEFTRFGIYPSPDFQKAVDEGFPGGMTLDRIVSIIDDLRAMIGRLDEKFPNPLRDWFGMPSLRVDCKLKERANGSAEATKEHLRKKLQHPPHLRHRNPRRPLRRHFEHDEPPTLTLRELQKLHAWYQTARKCWWCAMPVILDVCLCCDQLQPDRSTPQPTITARTLWTDERRPHA